jgi:phage shock protein PspC (stress-responsive transcriptional regulator)/heme/copper-type cytochrome/quinol oxidase subunit 2
MKKVININFQGAITPIEEGAYMSLQGYIESLKQFFANEEGRDEIVNDIESRIAELFSVVLKKGSTCITEDDVNAVIASIGRPEDFEEADSPVLQTSKAGSGQANADPQSQPASNGSRKLFRDENNKYVGGVCSGLANYFNVDPTIVRVVFLIALFGMGVGFLTYLVLWLAIPSSATKQIGATRKRLMRDTENKYIGGVSSGLGYYFGVNPWIPRILFLIPFFSFAFQWNDFGPWTFPHMLSLSFSPGSFIIYIILWLVLPEAVTTSDKLEMRGEKVDLNSIKNTITEEMKGVGQKVGKVGSELGQTISEKGKQIGGDVSQAAKRSSSGIGDFVGMCFKLFSYFILAVVLISVLGSLFGLGIAGTGLMPLKNYLLDEGWQSMFAWGTLLFFIWVPVIGIIVWIIRRITRSKANSSVITFTFIALWIIGWVSLVGLITSLLGEFKAHNNANEETVILSNAAVNKLEIRQTDGTTYYSNNNWLHIEPFEMLNGDTVFAPNVGLRIIKSNTENFQVKMVRLSNGPTTREANRIADQIKFDIRQHDSVLNLDKGIAINRDMKFRNQAVIVTVAVPVGKKIWIDDDVDAFSRYEFLGDRDERFWRHDREALEYQKGIEYIMTNDGLEPASQSEALKIQTDDETNLDINIKIEETKRQLEEINSEIEAELQQDESERRERLEELKQQQKKLEEMIRKFENGSQSVDSGYQYKPAAISPSGIKKDMVPVPMKTIKDNSKHISELMGRFSI